MTTAKTAVPSTYVSGFCGVRAHERCLGQYGGTSCTCACHQEPPTVEELEPLVPVLLARHCPTCHCGDPS